MTRHILKNESSADRKKYNQAVEPSKLKSDNTLLIFRWSTRSNLALCHACKGQLDISKKQYAKQWTLIYSSELFIERDRKDFGERLRAAFRSTGSGLVMGKGCHVMKTLVTVCDCATK